MIRKNPLVNVPLRYGLVGGLIAVAVFFMLYFIGENPLFLLQGFDLVIIPIFVFFAIKDFRDTHNGRELQFWQGMTVGFINYIMIGIISGLVIFLFLELSDSNILQDYVTNRIEMLEESKAKVVEEMGQLTYEQSVQEVKQTSAFTVAFDNFLKKGILGLMLTIIISIILRKQPKTV